MRYQNPKTNKYENWCFEDLPREEQLKILEDRPDFVLNLALVLADKINDIGDQLDLIAE